MRERSIYITPCLLTLALVFTSCSLAYRDRFKLGDEAIGKIESFNKDHGRLPESLAEVGIKETEGGPVFYHKKSSSRFIVSFTTGFDDGYFYDSATKEWKSYPPFPE